jgi:hypothetical protein
MMKTYPWTFAELNTDQLDLLKEGEGTLGADYLLAYQQSEKARAGYVELFVDGLRAAPLDGSQLECLEGLEQRLQAVVVAYKSKQPA